MLKRTIIVLIRAYQQLISPLLPPSCIYTPSCSNYALQAYENHGLWWGTLFSIKRLLRCWPWFAGGYDPVPGTECSSRSHHGTASGLRGQE